MSGMARRARRQLALAAPDAGHQAAAGEVDRLQRIEPGAAQPALHLVVGEAEMDVGVLALQLDQVVRLDGKNALAGVDAAPILCHLPGRHRSQAAVETLNLGLGQSGKFVFIYDSIGPGGSGPKLH